MSNFKWVTAAGQKMKPSEMETSHIENCMRLLERRFQHELMSAYSASNFLQGEMALMEVERGIEKMEEGGVEDYFPIYSQFKKELKKRKEKCLISE